MDAKTTPQRCEKGKRLYELSIADYNVAVKRADDSWMQALMFPKYWRHVERCLQCAEYVKALKSEKGE